MTYVSSIPNYFYGSSDFINANKINSDVAQIAGTTCVSIEESTSQLISQSQDLVANTASYIQSVKTTNNQATQVANSSTSSLNSLVAPSSNNYSEAGCILANINIALEEALGNQPATSPTASQVIMTQINSALKSLFGGIPAGTTNNSEANQVFNGTNSSLSQILKPVVSNQPVYAGSNECVGLFAAANQFANGMKPVVGGQAIYAGSNESVGLFAAANQFANGMKPVVGGQNVYANSGESAAMLGYINANALQVLQTSPSHSSSVYANSGESAGLFAVADNYANTQFHTNNCGQAVYANSGESAAMLGFINFGANEVLQTSPSHSSSVYANSGESAGLFSFINDRAQALIG